MSQYILGLHDPGPWMDWVVEAGKTAWCVYTEEVGADPNNHSGKDFARRGITPVVRLNHAYGKGHGTIPTPDKYDAFAQRCANFVAASQGIEYVVIGNEIALEWEWPTDQPLTLATYIECYVRCYEAIKRVAPGVRVAPAAVAPWNDRVPDAPDWIAQLTRMLYLVPADWICLHAYTRGYSPDAFVTGAKMDNPAYRHRYSGWEALWEFMGAIPALHRHLPVVITEANGNGPWPAENAGWFRNACAQIKWWNDQPDKQRIMGLCGFRWLPDDTQWSLAHSPGALDDFRKTLALGHRWDDRAGTSENPKWSTPATALKAGDRVTVVTTSVNVRNAPGLQTEVALRLSYGDTFVVEAVYSADGLIWLEGPHGWCAEVAPDGTRLVDKVEGTDATDGAGNDRVAIVRRLAAEYGVDERLARAVIQIESGGSGFRGGRLVIRFEPHIYRLKLAELCDRLFTVGQPAWEGKFHRHNGEPFHGNQDREYAALAAAEAILADAPYLACSYGAGQVMGFNHQLVGYPSARAMMAAFQASEEAQLRAVFQFSANKRTSKQLDPSQKTALEHLRAGNLLMFATIYNGPGDPQHYVNLINQQLARMA